MEFLGLLFALVVLAVPIATIIALVRVNDLKKQFDPDQLQNWAGRIAALERKIGELSRRLDEGGATRPTPPGPAAEPHAAPAPTPPPSTPPPPAQPPPPGIRTAGAPPTVKATIPRQTPQGPPGSGFGFDAESLIAGRWMNRIGILTLFLASYFFLRYAFENQWVGPAGKVTILLLIGAALLYYSQKLLEWNYPYFSSGVTALGGGVLYLSMYAAWDYYHLVPNSVSFAGMIVVTAALVAIALGRDSQAIAIYGLVGGYLTPVLLSTGVDAQVVLFSYLALLNAGMLVLARQRGWPALEPLAFLSTLIYFAGWYDRFYGIDKLALTLAFATLFFAEFTALPVLHARRGRELGGMGITLALLNPAWFLVALHAMLYEDHRWGLTVAVLALAAGYLGVARMVPLDSTADADGRGGRTATRLLFAGLALTFATLAIPIRLEGKWITIAWAVEGLVLMWTGFNIRTRMLRVAAFVLFGVTAGRLLFHLTDLSTTVFLWNARFAIFAVGIACFAASYALSRQNQEDVGETENGFFQALGLAANFFTLLILSLEIWDALGRLDPGGMLTPRLAQHLGLTVLWILYAAALIAVGAVRTSPGLRWQGLTLLGLAIAKVFLVDSSELSRGYRILSFFTLGVLLMIVSFYYQKRLREKKSGENPS